MVLPDRRLQASGSDLAPYTESCLESGLKGRAEMHSSDDAKEKEGWVAAAPGQSSQSS
jgi:hypothetical protein